MSSLTPTLRVQINQIDHTLSPSGFLDNTLLPRVPVIRIYGASSTGETACVHIHQVYPYFFVEYTGNLSPDEGQSEFIGWHEPLTMRSEYICSSTITLIKSCYCDFLEAKSALT